MHVKLQARMITCYPLSHPTRLTSQFPLLPFLSRACGKLARVRVTR